MPEKKKAQLFSNVEPTINKLAASVAFKENLSMSAYIRRLIITDLIGRGVLPEETLTRIVV